RGIVGAAACTPGARCDLSRGIVADDATGTVTFRLVEPDGEFLYKLALPFAVVLPRATSARLATKPLPATGPYRISAYQPNRSVRLVRNPVLRVWSSDAQPDGYPDAITATATQPGPKRVAARVRMIERGKADATTNIGFADAAQLDLLATRYPGRLHISTGQQVSFFFLNTRVP